MSVTVSMVQAAKTKTSAKAPRPKIPIKMRFKAWWDGNELQLRRKQAARSVAVPAGNNNQVVPDKITAERRIEMTQQIWGEGMTSPGGEDFILHLVKPFSLNPALTVLDITAGLGGPARTMADKFGVWVKGLEVDRDLAEAGMDLSIKAGMGKKAPVESFNPEDYEFKPHSVDCVFSKEGLFKIQDKPLLLKKLSDALKQRGQLIFTDYMRAKDADKAKLAQWIGCEPSQPDIWRLSDYEQVLAKLRMDVRIKDDMTEQMVDMIRRSWAYFMKLVKQQGIEESAAQFLVDELELWTRRSKAMEDGVIKVCRVHALVPDGDKKLSDWS